MSSKIYDSFLAPPIIAVFISLVAWFLDSLLPGNGPAFCIGLVALELVTIAYSLRNNILPRLLMVFLGLLCLADTVVCIRTHYLRLRGDTLITVVFAFIPFTFGYFCFASAIFKAAFRDSGRKFSPRILTIPLLITFSVTLFFLFPAFQWSIQTHGISFYSLVRIGNATTSTLLLISGLTIFLNSRNRAWVSVGLCGTIIILMNFCLGTEIYLGGSYQVNLYHYGWLFGVATLCIATLTSQGREAFLDAKLPSRLSLISQLRGIILLISIALLLLIVRKYIDPIPFVRTTFISLVIGCIVSLLLGEYLMKKVTSYSRQVGRSLNDIYQKNDVKALESLPIEIAEVLQSALSKDFIEFQIKNRVGQILEESAAKLAHDIRSPLAVLKTAMKGLGENGSTDSAKSLAFKAIEQIMGISNDLLVNQKNLHSQVTQANSEMFSEICPFELTQLVVQEKLVEFSHKPGVKLICDLPVSAKESLKIRTQPREMRRCLSNLINNAVEACGESGCVRIALHRPGENLEFSIKDDGCGMPPQITEGLGKRGLTFGKPNGSGLGFYQAAQTVELSKGKIEIHSTLGQGTEVILRFPVLFV